jgi:hypothetical protein
MTFCHMNLIVFTEGSETLVKAFLQLAFHMNHVMKLHKMVHIRRFSTSRYKVQAYEMFSSTRPYCITRNLSLTEDSKFVAIGSNVTVLQIPLLSLN